MTRIDQFESVFKSAVHTTFEIEAITIERVLVVSDLDGDDAAWFRTRAQTLLAGLGDSPDWDDLPGVRFRSVGDLLQAIDTHRPDLICTYRSLHSDAWRWPHSLGPHLDVLTQATDIPVLMMPRPEETPFYEQRSLDTGQVMALTDHLTGDAHLVSHAAQLTAPGGTLWLAHVEDQRTFDRYLEAIGKVPELDTDVARRTLTERLLKEPGDYIQSCAQVLEAEGRLTVSPLVCFGHRLAEIIQMLTEHDIDLLVLNTKDHDQMAMHGLAYPLAVELRTTPLLML